MVLIDRWRMLLFATELDTVAEVAGQRVRSWFYGTESGGEVARASWPDGTTWRGSLGTLHLHATTPDGTVAARTAIHLAGTDYRTDDRFRGRRDCGRPDSRAIHGLDLRPSPVVDRVRVSEWHLVHRGSRLDHGVSRPAAHGRRVCARPMYSRTRHRAESHRHRRLAARCSTPVARAQREDRGVARGEAHRLGTDSPMVSHGRRRDVLVLHQRDRSVQTVSRCGRRSRDSLRSSSR